MTRRPTDRPAPRSRQRLPQRLLRRAAALALALLGGCSATGLLNAAASHSTFTVSTAIPYGDGPRRKLDVYVPASPVDAAQDGAQHRPVVVFFYGGSWQGGDRASYLFAGEALASRGFVVVVPDYRTYPQTTFPGFIDDAAAAVRWARDHAAGFGGDPSKLFLMGHSAGAQIAVLLATDGRYLAAQQIGKREIRGVVGLAGPYDFLPLTDPVLEDVFPPATRAASQPINFVGGDEPPMFLAAGKRDKVVDPGNTDRLAAKLRATGDTVEVRHYPSVGHALLVGALARPLRGVAPVLADVTRFMNRQLDEDRASSKPVHSAGDNTNCITSVRCSSKPASQYAR
ncbi:alpha/beta hydrolase [Paraburkholderia sp.]|uniref:alpha/beta hydrolase n=1 Tax=Paraburkholderia sp. TaxID=1926495 RepID=UPI0023A62D00|nr:alpha/beta hydrolase [Paraburkholderia sp.]MDE1183495.1 alpha/beta hydrolase [Paraburkholderia sp.]